MRHPGLVAALSLLVLIGLTRTLLKRPAQGPASDSGSSLLLYCAAGIRPAVQRLAAEYEDLYGVRVELQYGGSGTLLANLEVARKGDLYIAADNSFIERAQAKGLAAEVLTLAVMRPVIGVAAGNPLGVAGVADLTREDVRVGLANPDTAAVGKVTKALLEAAGHWSALKPRVKVFKPTVNELANDLALGTVDASIIWDATARQYEEVDLIEDPALSGARRLVAVTVLRSSSAPTTALRFARFLASVDRGAPVFQAEGYEPARGDRWSEVPVIDLFCGAMLNAAIDPTISEFARREGVEVRRTYNGCGILVSQMKAGAVPDAYFSCDVSFLEEVRGEFEPEIVVSRNPISILVLRGNPQAVSDLSDLARPGLRVGLCNPEKSALGALSRTLLEDQGQLEILRDSGNIKVESATGDLLVNQLRTGSLDAALVYTSNAARARGECQLIPIAVPGAEASQPYAVARASEDKQLLGRLFGALTSARSRERFLELGFSWDLSQ